MRTLAAALSGAFALVLPAVGLAAAPAAHPPAVVAPPPAARALTAQDAEAWLDGVILPALKAGDIVGITVSIVKDGQVVLEKGYGYADLKTKTPVDPKTTLFRPGSISKTFTWTAVMQLVEQGKINLDADVNTYLDFKIPPRNGKPITVRNLMTHTTGFEENNKGLIGAKLSGDPLSKIMKRWTPTRVFDAGSTPAYSNYGAALAGYIVERVSGQKFEDYIAEHILRPLAMEHSTFAQPLPASLAPLMSKNYAPGLQKETPYEIVEMAPAGSMATTADDMTRYMIAHLNEGRLGEAQILKPETSRQMRGTLTQVMAPLNGMALGFTQLDVNGRRAYGHSGGTNRYLSNLVLFPDDHVGIFYSVNGIGPSTGPVWSYLTEGFVDRYLPAAPQQGPATLVDPKTAAAHAKEVAGFYTGSRGSFTNFAKLLGVMGQVQLSAAPDGALIVSSFKRGNTPVRFVEIAPYLWREDGGHERIFVKHEAGKPLRMAFDAVSGTGVWDREGTFTASGFLTPLLIGSFGLLTILALSWPWAAFARRTYGGAFAHKDGRAAAYRAVRALAFVALAAAGLWALTAQKVFDYTVDAFSLDGQLLFAYALTALGCVGGLAAALFNLFQTLKGPSTLWSKLAGVVILLAFAGASWFAWVAGLLSFNTHF